MNKNTQASRVIEYIESEYRANPKFLWPDRYPSYAVFRHGDNQKWFALVATISSKSLGLNGDKEKENKMSKNVKIYQLQYINYSVNGTLRCSYDIIK